MPSHKENLAMNVVSGAALLMTHVFKHKSKKSETRHWWCTEVFKWCTEVFKKCACSELMLDMRSQAISRQYNNFTRMSPTDFENILSRIGSKIVKQTTYCRSPISAQDRMSKQSIGRIIPHVCAALVQELKGYVKNVDVGSRNENSQQAIRSNWYQLSPGSSQDSPAWKEISTTFEIDWNLPHCAGALDGKHILLQALVHSGSDFYNYKSNFSIVLLALVDGYQMAAFLKTTKIPYCFVANSAFPLCENIMKPYHGDHASGSFKRIFNYRLSRARRVVENTFGILSVVFRVFRKPMLSEPPKTELIVMTIILLHNYLRNRSPTLYMSHGSLDREENCVLIEESWRGGVNTASMITLKNIPRTPAVYHKIRDEVADYCISWQNTYA
ncbi:hypothetical protein PR048_020817 [Dryococelus australis]|uniref:DDE Tnp4 domain-containing protein n=1 Tax=Dryococelus australis TaxID=614101 RepID=A0ABQ9GWG3_9NEOP|nr:hypothetical protein PR048_020817 [Dryococelus australis]